MQKYLTWGYLILICTVLPLYMKDGYYMLGEAKGITFIILSCVFVLGFLILQNRNLPAVFKPTSPVDYAVLTFLFSNIITLIFSTDKKVSLLGLEGWRMGFLPLLLMALCFYGFKEWTKINKFILAAGLVTPLLEFILGILNRFGIYPIDIYGNNDAFLATIGNINWYVGFLAIFVPVGIGLGYTSKSFSKMFFITAAYSYIGLMALLLQGSDSGLLVLAGSYLLLLFVSLEIRDGFKRFLLQLMVLGLAMETVCILMLLAGQYYTYEKNLVLSITDSHKGLIILAAALFLYRVSRLLEEIKGKWRGKLILEIVVGALVVGAAAVIIFVLGPVDYSFGNGRGVIWSISLDMFKSLSPWEKMVGAGQDCFYNYAYSHTEIADSLMAVFGGNTLTNAHCEMLTILIERGLFGLFSYLLLLGASMYSFWKNKRKSAAVACALPVFAYTLNGLVSFSTPISTPYVFILLGMGAHYLREKN